MTQTTLNYTGQRKDDTGLLYYHARYYDPSLARFVSPDSIVPGASSGVGGAGGTVGAWENSSLTVDLHESKFLGSTNEENERTNSKGFSFQLSEQERDKGRPTGPNNAQGLNRYAYTLNNPVRYTDPSGHEVPVCYFKECDDGYRGMGVFPIGSAIKAVARFFAKILTKSGKAAGTRLPAGVSRIEVASGKLDYLLKQDLGKAKGFDMLGFNTSNRQALADLLETAGRAVDTTKVHAVTQHGTKFEVLMEVIGPNGVKGLVETWWQIDHGTNVLRFVTAVAKPYK